MRKTHILSSDRNIELVNRETPNLFRDFFPYDKPPAIIYDGVIVPMNLPDDIWITDTTFRDGQQSRPPFTVKQIVNIFSYMNRINGKSKLIRQSEFFLYSEKDKKAVEECLALGYQYPEITGWIRAVLEDFTLVKEIGLKETGILTSVSDYHIYLKMKSDREKILDKYLSVVKEALSHGIIPRCHLEDVTRADFFGFVIPFAIELMKLADESGMKIKIRLCDTMGFGIPHAEASLPRSVPKIAHALIHYAGVPPEWMEWHGHNDFHKVHANSVAAWLYGISAINAAFFGMGERTGNSPIEALIFEYISMKGQMMGIQTDKITELANYMRDDVGMRFPENMPFIGKYFNVTRAGIHADGVIKNEEIYNIFDTEKLLNRPIDVLITDKSGIAGIAWWINSYLNLNQDKKVDKHHPGIKKIYKRIMEIYEKEKRITGISDDEMLALTKRFIPSLFVSDFDRIKHRVSQLGENILENSVKNMRFGSLNETEMEPVLEGILSDYPIIQLIVVLDLQGKRVTHNLTQVQDIAKFKNYTKQDFALYQWFTRPLENGKIFVTDLYLSEYTKKLIFTVSSPLFDKNDEIIGVISFDIMFEDAARLGEVNE